MKIKLIIEINKDEGDSINK